MLDHTEVMKFAEIQMELWHTVIDGAQKAHMKSGAFKEYVLSTFQDSDTNSDGAVDKLEWRVWFQRNVVEISEARAAADGGAGGGGGGGDEKRVAAAVDEWSDTGPEEAEEQEEEEEENGTSDSRGSAQRARSFTVTSPGDLGFVLRCDVIDGTTSTDPKYLVAVVDTINASSPLVEFGVAVGDRLEKIDDMTLVLSRADDIARVTFGDISAMFSRWRGLSPLFAELGETLAVEVFEEYAEGKDHIDARDFAALVFDEIMNPLEQMCSSAPRPVELTFSREFAVAASLDADAVAPHAARGTETAKIEQQEQFGTELRYKGAGSRKISVRLKAAQPLGAEYAVKIVDDPLQPGRRRIALCIRELHVGSAGATLGVEVDDELVSIGGGSGLAVDILQGYDVDAIALPELEEIVHHANLMFPPLDDDEPPLTAAEMLEEFDEEKNGMLSADQLVALVQDELLEAVEHRCDAALQALTLVFRRAGATPADLWRSNVRSINERWLIETRKMNARVLPELPGEKTGGEHVKGEVVKVDASLVRILGPDQVHVRFVRLAQGCRGWLFDRTLKKAKVLISKCEESVGDGDAAAVLVEEVRQGPESRARDAAAVPETSSTGALRSAGSAERSGSLLVGRTKRFLPGTMKQRMDVAADHPLRRFAGATPARRSL